jgi:hypothetical protein
VRATGNPGNVVDLFSGMKHIGKDPGFYEGERARGISFLEGLRILCLDSATTGRMS